jgi:hypothetical protein
MKDQTRNIETFKVGATRVNEFDFHKHQGEMHERHADEPSTGPRQSETKAERVARLTKAAHEKVMRRKKRH